MTWTPETLAAEAHADFQTQKRSLVAAAGGPRDALAMLYARSALTLAVIPVEREELRAACESREGLPGGIEAISYSTDALRRPFDESGPSLANHEVLATVAVDPEGNLAASVTPYHYENGQIVFEASETHHMLDQTVVEDLRTVFRG